MNTGGLNVIREEKKVKKLGKAANYWTNLMTNDMSPWQRYLMTPHNTLRCFDGCIVTKPVKLYLSQAPPSTGLYGYYLIMQAFTYWDFYRRSRPRIKGGPASWPSSFTLQRAEVILALSLRRFKEKGKRKVRELSKWSHSWSIETARRALSWLRERICTASVSSAWGRTMQSRERARHRPALPVARSRCWIAGIVRSTSGGSSARRRTWR